MEFWQKSSNFAVKMNKFVRDSAKLLSANAVAQAIGILVYPLLGRLYSPDDFGVLSLFMSIGGVAVLLGTSEYQYAIVLPKEEKTAGSVTMLCGLILAAVTAIVALTVPFAGPIAGLFRTPELKVYYWMLPLYVLSAGLWNILNYWYLRHQQYTRVSGYQVSQSVLSAAGKVGFGLAGKTAIGLPLASVLAQWCSLGLSVSLAWKTLRSKWEKTAWGNIRAAAKEYRNFPKFSLPQGLANFVFNQLPVFVLTPLFGKGNVGLWAMAFLLAFTPINVIAKSMNQVFFQRISSWVNDKMPIYGKLAKLLPLTLAVCLPCFAGLYFILPWLTEWLVGSQWRESGELIRWMLPWVTVALLIAPVGCLKDIFFKQKIGLAFEITSGVCRIIGLGIGLWQQDFALAIGGYAIASAAVNAVQYGWLLSLAKKYDRELLMQQ